MTNEATDPARVTTGSSAVDATTDGSRSRVVKVERPSLEPPADEFPKPALTTDGAWRVAFRTYTLGSQLVSTMLQLSLMKRREIADFELDESNHLGWITLESYPNPQMSEILPELLDAYESDIYQHFLSAHGDHLTDLVIDQRSDFGYHPGGPFDGKSTSEVVSLLVAGIFDIPFKTIHNNGSENTDIMNEQQKPHPPIEPADESLRDQLAEFGGFDLERAISVATALGEVAARNEAVERAKDELDQAVIAARAARATWAAIGKATGMTHQAANQRWRAMSEPDS